MKIKTKPEEIWNEYQVGISYKNSIDLYETVKENEDFVVGNQWEGVDAPDLEKPVLNFLKRSVAYYNATICSEEIGFDLKPYKDDPRVKAVMKAIARELDRVMELDRTKVKYRESVRNACVDGDGCVYFYWDPDVKTGGVEEGDIRSEIVENINVIFGNPHDRDVQSQPYIIICMRKPVAEVRDRAIALGMKKSRAEEIIPDMDERQGEKGDDNQLCTVLIKFWKQDGKIHVVETTEKHTIRKEWKPGTTRYPITWYQVDQVRKRYHGQAIVTGMIPNQININKLFAMYLRSVQMNAFPKTAYLKKRFPNGWSNRIGEAIAVAGDSIAPVQDSFTVIRGGDVSPQVMEVIQTGITLTKDCIGATDAALGDINAERAAASAIVATMQASQAPIDVPHRSYFESVEDGTRIILDLMQAHYGVRDIKVELPKEEQMPEMPMQATEPQTELQSLDFSQLDNMIRNVEVRVGSSAYWSELAQMQTMDNLVANGIITDASVYIEAIPDKWLPSKQKILDSLERMKQQQQIDPMTGQPMQADMMGANVSGAQQVNEQFEQMLG